MKKMSIVASRDDASSQSCLSPDPTIVSRHEALAGLASAVPATVLATGVDAGGMINQEEEMKIVDDMATAVEPAAAETKTVDEYADLRATSAIDFEPWTPIDGKRWRAPTMEEWMRMANPALPTMALAAAAVYKTKPELVAMMEGLFSEKGVMDDIRRGFEITIDYFRDQLKVLECAQCRMIVAASVLVTEDTVAG